MALAPPFTFLKGCAGPKSVQELEYPIQDFSPEGKLFNPN